MFLLWLTTGVLANGGVTPPPITQKDGGIGYRRKGPLPRFRPKVEEELEDVLAIVETISIENRTSENRKTAKAALAVVKKIEPPIDYAGPVASIQRAISKVARNAAKHEGMKAAVAAIVKEVDDLIASIQAERKRQEAERIRLEIAKKAEEKRLETARAIEAEKQEKIRLEKEQARIKRQPQEEEEIVKWLLNTISKLSLLPA